MQVTQALPAQTARFGMRRQGVALTLLWASFVVAALLLLVFVHVPLYGLVVLVGALVLALISAQLISERLPIRWTAWELDARDLVAVAVLYVAVVGLFKLAFGVFTTGNVAGLFLAFAGGMLVGVVGPIVYTVWLRNRPLASLGIGIHRMRSTLALAILFAAVQFSVTLWGVHLPQPVDWVPLLLMSITVGLFEAVFFRGFVQGTLERSIGVGPAVLIAAGLYGLYHLGYGMGAPEMAFLFGLGLVYAIAYRITSNLLVLWPLLLPMGSFFNQLQSGELAGQLPWLSMAGFADVLGLMALAFWLAVRHQRRQRRGRLTPAAA